MRYISRRAILRQSGAAVASAMAASLWPTIGRAQYSSRDALDFSIKLNDLEEQGDALSLPGAKSPLPENISPRSELDAKNAYLNGMPRLLRLIERAQGDARAASLADNASVYLSDLTEKEHSFTAPNPKPEEPRKIPQSSPPKAVPPGTPAAAKPNGAEYRDLYNSCEANPDRATNVAWHIRQLGIGKDQYQSLSKITGVPWYFIGIVHALEASFNFSAHLYNGDVPLSKLTRHVPKNRPRNWAPPYTWEASGTHALEDEGFTGQSSWSLEEMLYRFELYNGLGYRRKTIRIPSPYLWSFSNHYKKGKFIADGTWDASAVSQQCGAAVMLKYLENGKLIDKL
jgi:lysozyme family protein